MGHNRIISVPNQMALVVPIVVSVPYYSSFLLLPERRVSKIQHLADQAAFVTATPPAVGARAHHKGPEEVHFPSQLRTMDFHTERVQMYAVRSSRGASLRLTRRSTVQAQLTFVLGKSLQLCSSYRPPAHNAPASQVSLSVSLSLSPPPLLFSSLLFSSLLFSLL